MKRILCYGDSNTWGADPQTGQRYDAQTRYPRVLASLLGPDYEVVEEGLPGRTTSYHTDVDAHVNGKTYLYPCLSSHAPLDLVVIMLGTNDFSTGCRVNAYYAAAGVERLVNLVRHWSIDQKCPCPQVVVISPPLFSKESVEPITEVFDMAWASEESKLFRKHYSDVASSRDCLFLAAEDYTEPGCDGVHITPDSHIRLAEAIYHTIKDNH